MIQTVVHIIGYDIWFYISHLLLHTRTLYWIHRSHHTKIYPMFLDTYHGHPLESVIQCLGFFVPFAYGMNSPYHALASLMILNIRGMMRHDARTGYIIDGSHHLFHHMNPKVNFGEPWIDALCGTAANAPASVPIEAES